MICPKCGNNIPEGAACPYCGAQPLYSSNPAVNILKTIGASKIFMWAAICYTVAVVLGVLGAGESVNVAENLMDSFLDSGLIDPGTYYTVMSSMSSGTSFISEVFSSVPSILIAVALWMTFITCRNRTTGNISTAGLTICRVLTIIAIVGIGILIVLSVLAVILMAVGFSYMASTSYEVGFGIGFVVGVALVLAVALGLLLAMEISTLRTINRIKNTALTGAPDNRISKFLTGLLYVLAVFNGIGGLTTALEAPLSGLGEIAGAACMILVSIALTRYRKLMTDLMFPPPVFNMNGYTPGGPNP